MELKKDKEKLIKKVPTIFSSCISLTIVFLFFFICVLCSSSVTTKTACLGFKCPWTGKADWYNFQKLENIKQNIIPSETKEISTSMARRFLGGLGSSPPRCASKCGKCTPCKPVHVPVPPGTPVTAEYYPEAWRCKCGNRLYMP